MKDLTYKTIKSEAQANYRVMASKHLAYACPVRTETEIKSKLEALWKEHPQASHICYAWRIGWQKSHYRINDDGEPSGTAGRPIFGQIQRFDLTNILIAVVRYFGGTKLGTSGLIDAYKIASKLVLTGAEIVEIQVKDHLRLSFNHYDVPRMMKILKDLKMEKIRTNIELNCTIECLIKRSVRELFIEKTKDMDGLKIEFLEED